MRGAIGGGLPKVKREKIGGKMDIDRASRLGKSNAGEKQLKARVFWDHEKLLESMRRKGAGPKRKLTERLT